MKIKFNLFERILLFILLLMVLGIAAVSVWALAIRNTADGADEVITAVQVVSPESDAMKIFTGIGRLRAPLKAERDNTAGTVVVSPVFHYNSNDKAFTEELAGQLREFRKITLDYFAALEANADELSDELLLKQKLLERYNALLRLGKINELYFTDFIIID